MRPKFQTQIAVFFRFRASINLAEAAFSAIKRNIRRLNLQNSVKHAQINFLAAAWMQKNVGLKGFMRGVRVYQYSIRCNTAFVNAFSKKGWLEPEPIE